MKYKYLFSIISTFALSGCLFSQYMMSDEQAYKWGKEEGITAACLKYSKITDMKNIMNFQYPTVGIMKELRIIAEHTIGESVFGKRYYHIRNDYFFQSSGEARADIIAKARNENSRVSTEICSPYLRHYENTYYQLKAKYGY
ncbi:hypothetical protein ACERCG_02475 [Mannheimia sp. E30BD]|uniref:hypothetical protein n=1 Tax=Mannheimia sp. E30BD TaxID=3278708 RepID=UPI00359DDCE4